MATRQPSPRHALNEWRRHRAWALHQAGWTGAASALALDATRGAGSPWLKEAREGGAAALTVRIPPGATPKLPAEQRAELPRLQAHGAEAYGFLGHVWTTKR